MVCVPIVILLRQTQSKQYAKKYYNVLVLSTEYPGKRLKEEGTENLPF